MIDLEDEAWLPGGVTFADGYVRDEVLQQVYPVNHSAAAMLSLLGRRRPLSMIASSLSDGTQVPRDCVASDVIAFASRLNEAHLLNVRPQGLRRRFRAWSYVVSHLLLTRTFPPVFVTRNTVSGTGLPSLVATTTAALVRNLLPVWTLPAVVLLLFGYAFHSRYLVLAAPAVPTVFACLVVHEIGHAAAVHVSRGRSYVVTAGWQAGVVHSLARPSAFVHASGGLLAGAVGGLMVMIGHASESAVLVVVAFPFFLNLSGLTVATRDGRSLAAALNERG